MGWVALAAGVVALYVLGRRRSGGSEPSGQNGGAVGAEGAFAHGGIAGGDGADTTVTGFDASGAPRVTPVAPRTPGARAGVRRVRTAIPGGGGAVPGGTKVVAALTGPTWVFPSSPGASGQ